MVNLTDAGTLRAALSDVDVVINAAGVEDQAVAALITDHGAALVDITAFSGYVAAVERLDPPRPVFLSVGLAPGLTNLLAAAVNAAAPGPVDLAVVLGAGERHGAAAVAWSYGLLGHRFRDPATGGQVRNYTQPRRFDLPGQGRRRLYRADFPDQHVLTRDLQVPVRTYFGLDSRLATATLAALTWIPGASSAPRGLHLPMGQRTGRVTRHGGAGGDRRPRRRRAPRKRPPPSPRPTWGWPLARARHRGRDRRRPHARPAT